MTNSIRYQLLPLVVGWFLVSACQAKDFSGLFVADELPAGYSTQFAGNEISIISIHHATDRGDQICAVVICAAGEFHRLDQRYSWGSKFLSIANRELHNTLNLKSIKGMDSVRSAWTLPRNVSLLFESPTGEKASVAHRIQFTRRQALMLQVPDPTTKIGRELLAWGNSISVNDEEPFRMWKSTTGHQVEAKLIYSQRDNVRLQRKDGPLVEFPLRKLARDDQM